MAIYKLEDWGANPSSSVHHNINKQFQPLTKGYVSGIFVVCMLIATILLQIQLKLTPVFSNITRRLTGGETCGLIVFLLETTQRCLYIADTPITALG